MNTIVLIHKSIEIEVALEIYPPSSETQYCTLTPNAMAGCDKMGISYTPLEDYGMDGEVNKLKEKVHNDVLSVVEIGDKVLNDYYKINNNLIDYYVSPYRASIHRLAVLLGGSQIRLHYLKCMLSSIKPKKIVWFGSSARVLTEYNGNNAFSLDGSIEISLLEREIFDNIEIEDLSELCVNKIKSENNKYFFRRNIADIIKSIIPAKIKFYIKLLRICKWSFIKVILPRRHNIMVCSSTDIVFQFIPYLLNKGYGIKYIKDYYKYINKWEDINVKAIREKLYAEFETNKTFLFDGTDLLDFIFPLIGYLGGLAIPLSNIATKTEGYINKLNITCFFSIGANRAHIFALFQGAKKAGVKIITYQHGAFGAYGDIYMDYDDISISDYHICPGLGDLEAYVEKNNNYKDKCYPLGFVNSNYNIENPGNVKSANKDKGIKRSIVYITSMFYSNKGNFLQFNSVWKDCDLYRNQKIIINSLHKLVKENHNLDVIIKFHPSHTMDEIHQLNYKVSNENISIVCGLPSFDKLLSQGDIIVIDTPATTLIQSIVTKKPLFILNSNLKLFPLAKDRLIKRAIVKEDPQDLIDSLQDYIVYGLYPANVNDNEFSYFYSDPFGDGNAYERVSDFVLKTCSVDN